MEVMEIQILEKKIRRWHSLAMWCCGVALTLLISLGISVNTHADDTEPRLSITAVMVNINTADAETLAGALNGIGMRKAERIIRYREEHGDFQDIEDILFVKGVGPKFLAVNRGQLMVD